MPDKNGFFGHDLMVWFATLIGVVLHVLKPQHPKAPKASHWDLWRARAFATVAGFSVAIWGYAPVVDWRGLDGATWNVPVALFLSAVGGSIARIVIEFDYTKLMEIIKVVRGSSYGGYSDYEDYRPPSQTHIPEDMDDPEEPDDGRKNR